MEEKNTVENETKKATAPSMESSVHYIGSQVDQTLSMIHGEDHKIKFVIIATHPEEDSIISGNLHTLKEAIDLTIKVVGERITKEEISVEE